MAFEWADKPRVFTREQQQERLGYIEEKLALMQREARWPRLIEELIRERDELWALLEPVAAAADGPVRSAEQ